MNKATAASRRRQQSRPSASTPQVENTNGSAPSATEPLKLSKQAQVIAMLVSDQGATLPALIEATGWQSHTVRAALTGLRKRGYAISSDKVDSVRTYRGIAPE